jgi:hypothetical protein
MAALKALEGDGNAELDGTVLNSPVLLGRERTPLEPQNGLWNKLVKKQVQFGLPPPRRFCDLNLQNSTILRWHP